MLGEISEVVKTGVWVGDCFIFTSSLNRLNYYVGGEIVTIAHLDRYNLRKCHYYKQEISGSFAYFYLALLNSLHPLFSCCLIKYR